MNILANNFKRCIPKLGVLLLLLSFGVMTGFSTVLHAHELDLSSTHDDCFSCHWTQSNQSDKTNASAIETLSGFQPFYFIEAEKITNTYLITRHIRGPPPLS
jgi:nitrate/TMAO reductase-like tetraheme cytochrome c subunit